jgi:ADP-ribosylglycohydrolase
MSQSDRFRGCLLGLAVGDAVGTTVEFRPRGSFNPITGMVRGDRATSSRVSGPTTHLWLCA